MRAYERNELEGKDSSSRHFLIFHIVAYIHCIIIVSEAVEHCSWARVTPITASPRQFTYCMFVGMFGVFCPGRKYQAAMVWLYL